MRSTKKFARLLFGWSLFFGVLTSIVWFDMPDRPRFWWIDVPLVILTINIAGWASRLFPHADTERRRGNSVDIFGPLGVIIGMFAGLFVGAFVGGVILGTGASIFSGSAIGWSIGMFAGWYGGVLVGRVFDAVLLVAVRFFNRVKAFLRPRFDRALNATMLTGIRLFHRIKAFFRTRH